MSQSWEEYLAESDVGRSSATVWALAGRPSFAGSGRRWVFLSPNSIFLGRRFSVLSLALSTPKSAERNPAEKKEWGKGKWPCHISQSAPRAENERGDKARLCVPPPVKHVGGSVHKHGLIRINQTWPKITEKATDASN